MAIGDTVQAGLMRVDFSPFLEAGRANAAANASFGQALGQVAKGFIEGQEKKKRASEIAGFLMGQGVGEKDAMAIAKNPFLQNEYQRKQEAEAKMKMEQSRLATQSNIAAQGRAQKQAELEEGYRRQDEGKAETEAFYDRLNDTIATDELTPEAQQRIENFSSVVNPNDPRRSAQVNDPQAFMERVQNDPSSYVQKPVYELQGRDFLSQFEDPGMFQKALAFQQANQPKALSPSEKLAREEFEYKKSQDLNKPNLTDGEKSRDKKFGDQLVEFNLPDINKGLEQLTEASEALSKSNTLTGPIVSLMPNFVGDRVNPKAAEVREAVEEVVQRNLRLVLGAQFTEKEGERLISRAYNPTLDEAENKKRVERLIKSIKDAAQEKLNMKSYFEKNGTLKGYDSESPSIESIEQSAFGESAPAPQSLLDEIERKKQLRSKRAGL